MHSFVHCKKKTSIVNKRGRLYWWPKGKNYYVTRAIRRSRRSICRSCLVLIFSWLVKVNCTLFICSGGPNIVNSKTENLATSNTTFFETVRLFWTYLIEMRGISVFTKEEERCGDF